jgi:hypothetical protein
VTCPHCGQAAAFHCHRTHTPTSLGGPVRYARAYYLCRRGKGLCPFDQNAGLSGRNLTPGLERVAALAGAVADSLDKGADLLHEMGGIRLGESTVARTAEGAGGRVKEDFPAGQTYGPKAVWPWHKDSKGRTCASIEKDATGVRTPCVSCGRCPAGRRAHGTPSGAATTPPTDHLSHQRI